MKKNLKMKWVLLGYLIVAVVAYGAMYRLEKLDSTLDVAHYNQTVAMSVQ